MPTFYRLGSFDLYRDRADAENMVTFGGYRGPVEPLDIDAAIVFNETRSIGGWSIWSDDLIRPLALVQLGCHDGFETVGGVLRMRTVATFVPDRLLPGQHLYPRRVALDGHGVTPRAVSFIGSVLGADGSNARNAPWLTRVRDAEMGHPVSEGAGRGVYARHTLTDWTLTFADGTRRTVWVDSVGYMEGYMFDVYGSRDEAESAH